MIPSKPLWKSRHWIHLPRKKDPVFLVLPGKQGLGLTGASMVKGDNYRIISEKARHGTSQLHFGGSGCLVVFLASSVACSVAEPVGSCDNAYSFIPEGYLCEHRLRNLAANGPFLSIYPASCPALDLDAPHTSLISQLDMQYETYAPTTSVFMPPLVGVCPRRNAIDFHNHDIPRITGTGA